MVLAQEMPATVNRGRGCSRVRTEVTRGLWWAGATERAASEVTVAEAEPMAVDPRTAGALAGAAAVARRRPALASRPAATGSMPPMGVLTTFGATGRGVSAEAKETVGRATKTGVRATARAAEISRISYVREGQQGRV